MLLKSLLSTLFLISYLLPFTTSFSNLPMGTNTSAPKLQKRQNILLHGGFITGFRDVRHPKGQIRACPLGFAVRRVRGRGGVLFEHGYLTLAGCLSANPGKIISRANDVIIDADGKGTQLKVGKSTSGSARYLPEKSLNYAIVRVFPEFWGSKTSMNIFVLDDRNDPKTVRMIPVSHSKNPNPANYDEICFWGGYSHHVCGAIITLSAKITRPRPWGKRNLLLQHVHDMDYFSDMGLVSLPAFTSAQLDIATGDPGSPVYIPKRDANNRIILAYPAGLFDSYCVDYTVVLTPQGWIHIPLHPHESCFFYHPLDRILADNPDLELILSPENEN